MKITRNLKESTTILQLKAFINQLTQNKENIEKFADPRQRRQKLVYPFYNRKCTASSSSTVARQVSYPKGSVCESQKAFNQVENR